MFVYRVFCSKVKIIHYLCAVKITNMTDTNRIKLVLVEKKKTNKWLSEQMNVAPSTVSKWCTNSSQPDLDSLLKISDLLKVDIRELITREYRRFLVAQENNNA